VSGTATTPPAAPPASAPPAPLPNPNTTFQPTVGASSDPATARVDGLVTTQQHGYDTLVRAMVRLQPGLAEEDASELEAAMTLLRDGGEQAAIEAGADSYEACLAHLTPTLGADDLSALNGVLTDLRFLANRLRTGDVLPALPDPADPDAPVENGVPTNVDVPVIAQSGTNLHCTMGNWTGEPTSYAYQWQLDGANVGTDAASYAVTGDDVGKSAACVVTATNGYGSTAAPPSNIVTVSAA